jgi:hypothetical protein
MAIVRKSPSRVKAAAPRVGRAQTDATTGEDTRRTAIGGGKDADPPAAPRSPVGHVLLLEAEVAERLRCSTSKIKRLRLSGVLPYIPGRPVLITEDDLAAFIETLKCQAQLRLDRMKKPDLSTPEGQKQAEANAALRARQIWTLRQTASRLRRGD